jgi:hypothetical protein
MQLARAEPSCSNAVAVSYCSFAAIIDCYSATATATTGAAADTAAAAVVGNAEGCTEACDCALCAALQLC